MKTDARNTNLLAQIRIGHAALIKEQRGIQLLQREVEILQELGPVDVTQVLLDEIDSLNNQIINLIYQYSVLQSEVREKVEKHLDIGLN
jgi:hypothetical protein